MEQENLVSLMAAIFLQACIDSDQGDVNARLFLRERGIEWNDEQVRRKLVRLVPGRLFCKALEVKEAILI
jgi:hypothetical protein